MKKEELTHEVITNIKQANSITDLLNRIGIFANGHYCKLVREIIKKNQLDTSHFGMIFKPIRKYPLIEKACKICNKNFITSLGSKKEKNFCSISCANTGRPVSEETKIKLKTSLTNKKFDYLISKYGNNIIGEIIELRTSGETFNSIKKLITEITSDDLSLLFRIDNFKTKKIIKEEEIIDTYFLLKNKKRVAEKLGISHSIVKNILNGIHNKNGGNFTNKSKYVISWRKRTKQKLIDYKGGGCEKCGYHKTLNALTFHHLNPKEKDFTISGKSYSFERLKKEVDKCILVCANCHAEIHDQQIAGEQ